METERLESITHALDNILSESKYEFRTRWLDENYESPLATIYNYYQSLSNRWRGEEDLVLNPYSLETEVKENFLRIDERQQLNYVKLLNHKIATLNTTAEEARKSLTFLKNDIKNGIIDDRQIISFNNDTVSSFIYRVEDTLRLSERVVDIINDNIAIFYTGSNGPVTPDSSTKLRWKGDKTDLAELVWTLAKSGRVTDTSTGKDATQKELAEQIAVLLGLDSLDITSLMKGRYGTKTKPTSYKAQDGKTFVNELQKLLDNRVID